MQLELGWLMLEILWTTPISKGAENGSRRHLVWIIGKLQIQQSCDCIYWINLWKI